MSSIKTCREIIISALSPITTNNANEMTSQGKIGPYFNHFLEKYNHPITPEHPLFVCYAKYVSDYKGNYDFFMGIQGDLNNPELEKIIIPASTYMVFACPSTSTESVVQTWEKIWQYFDATTEYTRAYTLDFQIHKNDSVEIYIALK